MGQKLTVMLHHIQELSWTLFWHCDLKCIWHEFFISLFERAFKMMKNGVHFTVIALLVAQLFKILVYASWVACGVALWTQNGVTSQKMEYLRRLFPYRTETLSSCCNQHKVSWYFHCGISMATQWTPGPLHSKDKIRVFLLQEALFALVVYSVGVS